MFFSLVVALHVIVSLFLIFVILLQPGKGDGMAAMGGGSSNTNTVFGGSGSVTFLAKVTEMCAVIFMITSLTLAYRSSHSASVLQSRRNLAAADAAAKSSPKPLLPTGQSAPAQATGGAAVPVPAPVSPPSPAKNAPAKK